MCSYESFKQNILTKIKTIDAEYKHTYKNYTPSENERKLITFLDDIWGIRFQNETLNEAFKNASIQCFFIDKNNINNCLDKSFKLTKLYPKQNKTTPLYFLISRLAESKDYHFFLCPNIYIKTKKCLHNWEKNISASNTYFIDIDELHTDKPIYNCSEKEILDYLHKEYPVLKKISPSYILMSGGGLHLYFTLEHTECLLGNHYNNQNRYRHKQLTSDLIKLFNADKACKNLNRLLRVPFSINVKYPVKTRFYCYENLSKTYSYETLSETVSSFLPTESAILPVQKKEVAVSKATSKTKSTKQKEPVKRNYNTTPEQRSLIAAKAREKLFSDRRKDLEKWFHLHLKNMEGYRHNSFLIYSIILKQQHNQNDYIENQCRRLNTKLYMPLSESELLKIIHQDHQYHFRNETIAEWLNFTQAEIATMCCHYGENAITEYHRELTNYYNERKKEEAKQKRELKQSQIFKVFAKNPDATILELSNLLGFSTATVSRWKKKYKESL